MKLVTIFDVSATHDCSPSVNADAADISDNVMTAVTTLQTKAFALPFFPFMVPFLSSFDSPHVNLFIACNANRGAVLLPTAVTRGIIISEMHDVNVEVRETMMGKIAKRLVAVFAAFVLALSAAMVSVGRAAGHQRLGWRSAGRIRERREDEELYAPRKGIEIVEEVLDRKLYWPYERRVPCRFPL